MVGRDPNIWQRFQLFALGLFLLGLFAPLPDPLGGIFSAMGAALLVVDGVTRIWAGIRREHAEYLADLAERERIP
jgi:hypothetical protein